MPRPDRSDIAKALIKEPGGDIPKQWQGFISARVVNASPPPAGPLVELKGPGMNAWKGIYFGPCITMASVLITLQLLESTETREGPSEYMDLKTWPVLRYRDREAGTVDLDESRIKKGVATRWVAEAKVEDPMGGKKAEIWKLLQGKLVLVHFIDGDPDEPIIFDVAYGAGPRLRQGDDA
ncbi:MAG: hypothetical protein ABR529_15820 [Actinomycetota bacterium]